MLAQSAAWPPRPPSGDWPTFAGSPQRNKTAPALVDVGEVAWRVPLAAAAPPEVLPAWGTGPASPRAAEDPLHPLSCHPVVIGNLVLVNNLVEIFAYDLTTGKAAWGHNRAAIYQDPLDEDVRRHYVPAGSLGQPRFTLTVCSDRLYARLGAAWTSRSQEFPAAGGSGYLLGLDLAAEGRLAWNPIRPEQGWAFEGTPVADVENFYVAMRHSDIRPHLHVACYDAQSGQRRWRRWVCAAESPAQAAHRVPAEITHNLLTLQGDTLYYNTNLGAVAALSARDGRVRWVTLYPRILEGDLAHPQPYEGRDLSPCLFDRGILYVAPADSPRIFALDAATGQILWQSEAELADAVHLLGVAGDRLIVGGNKIYWIGLQGAEQGKIVYQWPHGNEKLGRGRGILAGDCVLWPTAEKIFVFDQATGRIRREIALVPRHAGGGNLLVARGRLLIATDRELIAFIDRAAPPAAPDHALAERPAAGRRDSFLPHNR